eukprot:scaffold439483_cov23-Prasinocladus_malaysianus.AAC.1
MMQYIAAGAAIERICSSIYIPSVSRPGSSRLWFSSQPRRAAGLSLPVSMHVTTVNVDCEDEEEWKYDDA